jgi:starch phosphorylase
MASARSYGVTSAPPNFAAIVAPAPDKRGFRQPSTPERLLRLLTDPQRPIQLIMAGKAHPADQPGRALIQQWTRFAHRPEARAHVIFLSDYDMLLTEQLVQGVDLWLNTPRRPWEACGTSGMKVLVNGGMNLSELDGWWAEACTPDVGWALGDGQEHGDDPAWDASDAEALYDLLEHEVVPQFYALDQHGIPGPWVARMRESVAHLTPRFSSNRAVREYTEQFYLPAASAYLERAADKGKMGVDILDWRHALDQRWSALRFSEVQFKIDGEQCVFEVQLYLDGFDPKAVRVELYADGVGRHPRTAGDEACSPCNRRDGRPYLQRGNISYPAASGLHSTRDTVPCRHCGSTGGHTNPLAAMIKSPAE